MALVAIVAPWAAANPFTPNVTLQGATPVADESVRPEIIAGQDAVYQLSIGNDGTAAQFNTSVSVLVPNDVHFVLADALLGTPTIYASGDRLPDSTRGDDEETAVVPEGYQRWVWENIADLPPGGTLTPTFTVRPRAGVFPVGATVDLEVTAYTSADPNLLPAFPGSSSVATDANHTSQPGTADERTPVKAVRIHKSEPSPESELLRGVHDNSTTYTLRVLYTGEGETSPITVTDYLPAGLEYLGGGGIDNTNESAVLHSGNPASTQSGDREYPGAASLANTPAPVDGGGGHLPEESVETVVASSAEAAEYGLVEGDVYTKVTWVLPENLGGGTAQAWDDSPGVPGEYVIRYRAAVPLFENTMTWTIGDDTDAPVPGTDGAQTANLNNNNGPSTRHGAGSADHTDATSYTNVAVVEGEYQGARAQGEPSTQTDSSTEVIDAVDLRILKSVADATFVAGAVTTYTLDLATSEYTSADDIVVTDTIGNGMCPMLPVQEGEVTFRVRGTDGTTTYPDAETWSEAVPGSNCDHPSAGGQLDGATLTALLFDETTGAFELTLTVPAMAAQARHAITYAARENEDYIDTGSRQGPTSSGDAVANEVQVEATTHAVEALAGMAGADGPETVWEDSEAWVHSEYTTITKSVLERDAEIPAGDITAADGWVDSTDEESPFILGDDVWYRLTVDFPDTIVTRNPVVTDFLPQGVELRDGAAFVYSDDGLVEDDAVQVRDSSVQWALGVSGPGENRFVPAGTVLHIYVPATVVGLSASATAVDMPQNLMKYQQENSDGDVYFLRDDATITVDHGMTLLKGVEAVNDDVGRDARSQGADDGSEFNSDRDGIEVVQGERVTYRLDLTAPAFPTTDLVVWDVLPEGIGAGDVDASRYTARTVEDTLVTPFDAVALDPTDTGYPAVGDEYEGRSVIVWTVGAAIDAGTQLTLGYDVVVPAGALVTQEYENLAGIAAYDAVTNRPGDETVTYVPDGPFERPVDDGEHRVPGTGTFDDSLVRLPAPQITKWLDSTEIAPSGTDPVDVNNGDGQIVQGEHAIFSYSVTLPAHTSVQGGVLSDDGAFVSGSTTVEYTPVRAELVEPASGVPDGFTFDNETGQLEFPARYDVGPEPQTFTVELTVWVDDADASEPNRTPNLAHGTALTNTASFTHEPPAGGQKSWTDTATVTYLEPELSVDKSADPATEVDIDTTVEYTITVTNSRGRPASYDTAVTDRVPEGLIVDTDSLVAHSGTWNEADRTITWPTFTLVGGESRQFSYTAGIDPAAGGAQTYTNEVDVTGFTLPSTLDDSPADRRGDRVDDAAATVTTVDAVITKGVRTAGSEDEFEDATSVPVGDTVEYEVAVTLHPYINYWDPVIVDTLPTGVVIQDATVTGPTASDDSIDGTWAYDVDGNVVTWTYAGDIRSDEAERTVTITYRALVTDDVALSGSLENTAEFTWNLVNDDDGTRTGVVDEATVTLLHPELEIAKTVNDLDADAVYPAETFSYRLVVTNEGDTPAHNLVVTDTVPVGVVVDPDSITAGGVLTGGGAEGGGTIVWDHAAAGAAALKGPLHPAGSDDRPQSITLTYDATLAPSAGIADDETFTNTTRVTEWKSFATGGRGYGPSDEADAVVTAAFPHLSLAKAPTGGTIAYAGEDFGWTLTATNTGDGPAHLVELIDTLPANWTYAGTTSVSVAGTAQEPDDYGFVTTGTGEGTDRQVLTWTFEGTPVLAPGATIRVAFLATPSEAALGDAGVGSTVPHSNTLKARATDPSGVERNESGPYVDPETPANAYIHSADLALRKTAAGDGIVAGTPAATGWTITVTNNGPDTAVGPFTVSDTTGPLPEGVEVTGVSGDGWVSGPIERNEDGATTFTLSRIDSGETLADGASFPDIEVNVRVASDVAPTEVDNAAVVSSTGTHDPDPSNNNDEDPLPITEQADLVIEKSLNTAEPNAGEAITWQLDPRNDGPSVSRSTGDEPITITDVVPPGITVVSEDWIDGGTDWTADAADGFPATTGETITFTYTGEVMPVGPSGSITLTGMIDPSWPANTEIANTAVIHPGPTPDPDGGNNTSTVTTTPGTDTMLDVTKTRVVAESGGWVTATEPPIAGEPVSYLVTVANLGPADAQNVTVVDRLPEYLSYGSFASVEGTWSRTGGGESGAQNFALSDPAALAPGASASFVLTAGLASGHTGNVENWAQADADNSTNEPEDGNSSSSTRDADLSIVKSHTGDAVAGETLDYTLTVANEGPSSSSGPTVIEDVLPAGFSYVGGTATVAVAGGPATQVEPVVDGQWLTWTIGDGSFALATGQTIVLTLRTAIADDVPAQTALVNSAIVHGPDDTDPSNNRDADPTDVITHADMTVTKTVEEGPWVAGTEVEYTFTVTNLGPSVTDAVVTDVWPAGLTGVSIDGEGWDCHGATCGFTGHPVGTTTLTVTALVDQAVEPRAELTNEAHLTWTDSRGSHEDEDPATIEVSALADLGLVKTAVDTDGNEVTEATAGEQARFRLDVTNHGPSLAAAPVTVVDTLPEGLTYVGLADTTHWTATADGREVTFVLDDGATSLAAGAQAPELTLVVQVDAGLPVTDEPDTPAVVNVASVTSGTPEPADDPHPNEDDAPLEIVHAADLEIIKSHEGEATIDEELRFDVVVTNHGPSTAQDVTVTETVPAGLAYVGYAGEGWTQLGDATPNDDGTTTVEYALAGTIAVNADAAPLTVLTTVTAAAYPEVTNVVVVQSPQPDPDPGNNEDEDPARVTPDADLTITKETLTEAPHAGRELRWRLTPTNLGPAESASTTAHPITITDTLPNGIADVTVETGSDWTATASDGFPAQGGDTITLTYVGADAMPVGDTAPVILTGTIESSVTGEITNLARIVPGPTPDRDPDNNTDEVTDPVDDTTAIAVVKTTVDPATGEPTDAPVGVVPGTQLTYALTVSTTGTADARDVTLVDELPDGLRFASFADVEPAVWTSSTEPGATSVELTLTGPLAAPDGRATVRITADVTDDLALDTDDVTNVVTAGAGNVPEEEWPTDEVTDPLDPSADLSITKSHTGAVVAGLPVQYTLVVENHGPSVSPGPVTVTDVLPAGMTYVEDSAQVTDPAGKTTAAEPTVDEQQLTWMIDDVVVPVDGTLTVTFAALVAPDVPATADPDVPALVNTGEVDGPVDANPENNEDEDPTTVIELTDVNIVKTVIGTGPFTAGTEVHYELTVTVAGPSIARDVVLSDVVPDGLSLVSIGEDGDGWTWDATAGVGTRDTLALGEHVIPVTALVDQAVPSGETLTNTGVVEWTDSDGPKREDDPEEIDVVTDGDLGIVKTAVDADGAETDSAVAGAQLRYTLEVTNHGPSQAGALLEITDQLPEGVSFLGVVGDDGGWTVLQDGQQLTFTHPLPLAAGDTAPALTIATQVAADVADGEELVNVATVESVGTDDVPGTPDSNPGNDEDDAVVTVARAVDLSVAKAHGGEARIGHELTFDLAVRNAGPSEATDVVVIDTLPAGLAFRGAAGEGWEVTADGRAEDGTTTVTAALDGPLAPGTDAPALQVTVLVEPGAYPEVTNVADVTSTEPDENRADNTSSDPVRVPAQADLAVVKTVDTERLRVGGTAVYTLTVTNHGPTEHVGEIAVVDTLPTGLRATAVDGTACEILEDGALVECVTADNLAVGDSLAVTVDVEVLAGAWTEDSAEVTNTAAVTGTSEDPGRENNTSTVTTPVDPDVRFELEKARGAVDGDAVDWTITVRSVGLNDAVDGVVVVDRLPAELRYEGVSSEADVACAPGGGRTVECVVVGPIPTGESVELTIRTTTSQDEGTTVTNTAWLVDPGTGQVIPDTEDTADHRVGGLPVTGAAVGVLAVVALLLLLGGAVLRSRVRTG